jgi:hypothetical protein
MTDLQDGCTCHPVHLNSRDDVVGYNWEPTCPNHGLKSAWYRDEGKAQHDADAAKLRDLQERARESRITWETRENRCKSVLDPAPSWCPGARCERDAGHDGLRHLSQLAGREW